MRGPLRMAEQPRGENRVRQAKPTEAFPLRSDSVGIGH
jgi:hypothetical protein